MVLPARARRDLRSRRRLRARARGSRRRTVVPHHGGALEPRAARAVPDVGPHNGGRASPSPAPARATTARSTSRPARCSGRRGSPRRRTATPLPMRRAAASSLRSRRCWGGVCPSLTAKLSPAYLDLEHRAADPDATTPPWAPASPGLDSRFLCVEDYVCSFLVLYSVVLFRGALASSRPGCSWTSGVGSGSLGPRAFMPLARSPNRLNWPIFGTRVRLWRSRKRNNGLVYSATRRNGHPA